MICRWFGGWAEAREDLNAFRFPSETNEVKEFCIMWALQRCNYTRTHRYTHKHILIHSHQSDLWVILALPHPHPTTTTTTASHSLTSVSQRDAAESRSLNAVPPPPTQPNSPLSGHLATTSLGPSLMDDLSFLIILIFCSLVIVIHKMKREDTFSMKRIILVWAE